jgi:hypothetical protein
LYFAKEFQKTEDCLKMELIDFSLFIFYSDLKIVVKMGLIGSDKQIDHLILK